MMKCYSIQKADGGVAIMQAVEKANPQTEIGRWAPEARATLAHPLVIREIELFSVPQDREFRNAWTDSGVSITVDMTKAREVHRERLRRMRKPKMLAFDTEYLRADEAGNLARKSEIAAQKQALRDCTADPSIDAAQTTDELKAAIPACLRS